MSFNLKWNSSSRELLEQIREAELQGLNQVPSTGVNTPSSEALLNNTFGKAYTESEVSKLLGSSQIDEFLLFFEPNRILKVLLRALCAESVKWDELLQGRALEQWNCFVSEARALSQLSVLQCYFLSNVVPTQSNCTDSVMC